MKILVEREFLKDSLHELKHNEKNGVNNVTIVLERLLKDNPESTTKQLTPEETVEFLIEITDTLAAYLWNKKEETTTHQYAKYLDELREKLEEYNS
jgi:hypothetical protein